MAMPRSSALAGALVGLLLCSCPTAPGAAANVVLHVASLEQQLQQAEPLLPPDTFASVAEAREALRALQPLPVGGASVLLHVSTLG